MRPPANHIYQTEECFVVIFLELGKTEPEIMSNSTKKMSFPRTGRCIVCGRWMTLEMWDDGLQGRFCRECLDEVAEAEEVLSDQGLAPLSHRGDAFAGLRVLAKTRCVNPIPDTTALSIGTDPLIDEISGGFGKGTRKQATDIVSLGETGLTVTRMAISAGAAARRMRSREGAQGCIKSLADLLEYSFERGLRFWDSVDPYGTNVHLRAALKRLPREEVVILAKTTSGNPENVLRDLERYRCELGTDYVDIVMLHCLTDADWPRRMRSAMDAISEAKRRGLVRSHGVSCNTMGALRSAVEEPWVEVGMARINPTGIFMDADPNTVLSVLHQMEEAGKGVIGMKIFGGGRLADRVRECLRFVLAQDCLDCFSVGIESKAQLDEVLRQTPLSSP